MLLGNGTDLQRFDPGAVTADSLRGLRTELGIPEGVPVVGTIGRLVREKGYEDLLEAADLVRAVVPDVRLLLVGARGEEERDGFSRDEIAARKAWMVLTEWRTDIPALLALMDVFVLASWREGMPRSAIEAAAMARPQGRHDPPGRVHPAGRGDGVDRGHR